MTMERKRRVFALLRDLVDVDVAEQPAWIDAHSDDAAMAQELRELLRGSQMADVLDGGAAALAQRMEPDDADVASGTVIGGWRVVRPLGTGGMGVVYLVERDGEDYRQQGALKLIKRGMDSSEVLASFRRERRILSQLDHPHLARLLDGGIADDGRPWLVMEYVDGEPLLAWTRRHEAGLDGRIALFLQVCDAVAAAHRQLVVHRDIKPANVLVDSLGNARLLDFGIAKVLEDSGSGERTVTAGRFLSRAYAAPEQTSAGLITTATDVYQLGLLLGELLSGASPAMLANAAATRASQRLVAARESAGADGPLKISPRQLRGDAGIIVGRASDADPARRYASVEALADDVRRWRDGLPILARPDSTGYRLRRFIGRHPLGTALGTLAVVALLSATSYAAWQAQRAEREADAARSAQAFLTGIFDAAAPDTARGRRVTARELLDRGSERARSEFANQPQLRAEMLLTLGGLYRQLGQFDDAATLLVDARAALPASDALALHQRINLELGVVERERGNLPAAASLLDALVDQPDLSDGRRSQARAERALLREKQGDYQPGLDDARAAASIDSARGVAGAADLTRDRQIEGLLLTRLGQFDAARPIFEQAIAGAVAVYGDGDTRVALMRNDYGALLLNKGRLDDGEALVLRALQARRERLDANHPAIAESLQVLGAAQRQQGRYEDAEKSFTEAAKIQRASLGEEHSDLAVTLNSLGILGLMRQRFNDADGYFAKAISINDRNGQGATPSTATMISNRGLALMRLGQYDEAATLLTTSLDIHRKALGNDHPLVMVDLNGLAQLQTRLGDFVDAERNIRDGLRIAAAAIGPGRDQAGLRVTLATVLLRAGKPADALVEARDAVAMFDSASTKPDPRRYGGIAVQADALLALGRTGEAAALARQVLDSRLQRQSQEPAGVIAAYALVARSLRAQGDKAAAQAASEQGSRLLAALPHPDPELERELQR